MMVYIVYLLFCIGIFRNSYEYLRYYGRLVITGEFKLILCELVFPVVWGLFM